MPSFTVQVSDLEALGPIADIHLALVPADEQALREAGRAVPAPLAVAALVDTGATGGVVRTGLAQELGLHPVGTTLISTASASGVPCNLYTVRYVFSDDVTVEGVAAEAPLGDESIDCLIGRDVLAHAVLVYIGNTNQYTLSF